MATARDPHDLLRSNAGKANFQRLTRLLITGGTALLKEIFDKFCPPNDLPKLLRDCTTKDRLKAAKLSKPQRDCLYPSPGVYGRSEDFDVTLLFRLLRILFTLIPPATGWDELPASGDHSLEADLARIKYYRNSIYGHASQKMEISDAEFSSSWKEISEALVRIAGHIGPEKKTEWQKAINTFLTDPLTEEDGRNVEELRTWYRNDVEVKKAVEKLETTSQEMKDQMDRMDRKLSVLTEGSQEQGGFPQRGHNSRQRSKTRARPGGGPRGRFLQGPNNTKVSRDDQFYVEQGQRFGHQNAFRPQRGRGNQRGQRGGFHLDPTAEYRGNLRYGSKEWRFGDEGNFQPQIGRERQGVRRRQLKSMPEYNGQGGGRGGIFQEHHQILGDFQKSDKFSGAKDYPRFMQRQPKQRNRRDSRENQEYPIPSREPVSSKTPAPSPADQSQFERNKILVRGLSEKTSRDGLVNFIEAKSGGKEVKDVQLLKNGKALVIMADEIKDFTEIKTKCEERSLDDAKVSIEQVLVCKSILVTGFSDITHDFIKQYFESPRSGGGPLEKVYYVPKSGRAVVVFQDAKDLERVLYRHEVQPHEFKQTQLSIRAYREFLEDQDDYGAEDSSDVGAPTTGANGSQKSQKPDANGQQLHIAVNPDVMEYVTFSGFQAELNSSLPGKKSEITWNHNAASLGNKLMVEEKVQVDEKSKHLLMSSEWQKLCDEMNQTAVCVWRNNCNDTFVAGSHDDVTEVIKKLNTFLENNCIREERFVCTSDIMRRYFLELRQEELRTIENQLKDFEVSIKKGKDDDDFIISGKREGLKHVRKEIDALINATESETFDVKQPGFRKYFESGKGDRLMKSVEKDEDCAIKVQKNVGRGRDEELRIESVSNAFTSSGDSDDDAEDDHATTTGTDSSTLVIAQRHRVSWKPGNIEAEKADVLVSSLGACGQAIMNAGGPQAATPNVGDITVSGGYSSVSHVIHTNCCEWNNGEGEPTLRAIVQKCLQTGEKLGANSIAFPVIGTGNLHFPRNAASRIMLEETVNFCRTNPGSHLRDIRFVVFDQNQALTIAFKQEMDKLQSKQIGHAATTTFSSGIGVAQRMTLSSSFNIEVINGDLTHENSTDAIMNILSTDMNMNNAGELSKAIARKSGPLVQQECNQLGKQPPGTAIMTRGGNLQVPFIIHLIPGSSDKQHLLQSLEEGLRLADANNFQAISIPCVGTGGYGLTGADSAQLTFKALNAFSARCKNIKKVRVIVFQASTMQDFLLEQKKKPVRGIEEDSDSGNAAARQTRRLGHRQAPSQGHEHSVRIFVIGKDKVSVRKAVESLRKGFSDACAMEKVESDVVSQLSDKQKDILRKKAKDRDVKGTDKGIALPRHWTPMPSHDPPVHKVQLLPGSPEYQDVVRKFQATAGALNIQKIERVQNPHLYQSYMVRKQIMDKDTEGNNERQLFHGTDAKNIIHINTQGFNRSFCGDHGTAYGRGVYFARDAQYSFGYASGGGCGGRHMYLAKVLVGQYCVGDPSMIVPPPKSWKPEILYDSVVDNQSSPNIFVVFFDNQCYPEYLITF